MILKLWVLSFRNSGLGLFEPSLGGHDGREVRPSFCYQGLHLCREGPPWEEAQECIGLYKGSGCYYKGARLLDGTEREKSRRSRRRQHEQGQHFLSCQTAVTAGVFNPSEILNIHSPTGQ